MSLYLQVAFFLRQVRGKGYSSSKCKRIYLGISVRDVYLTFLRQDGNCR